MVGAINTFFFKGGWAKLPWKNSWFALAIFAAFFSGSLLIFDFSGGKIPHGSGGGTPSLPFFSKPGSLAVDAAGELRGDPQISAPGLFEPDDPEANRVVNEFANALEDLPASLRRDTANAQRPSPRKWRRQSLSASRKRSA